MTNQNFNRARQIKEDILDFKEQIQELHQMLLTDQVNMIIEVQEPDSKRKVKVNMAKFGVDILNDLKRNYSKRIQDLELEFSGL